MNSTPSNHKDRKEMVDHFISLATIDSISLDERNIADHVKKILAPYSITVVEDSSASQLKGTTGNLLCFPPHYDRTKPCIALCAHLDTVKPTKNLRPVVTETTISSDGTTILGADNREGLAILTYIMQHLTEMPKPLRNFICVFTVGEELGMYGANAVDLAPYNVHEAYVFDSSRRPGIYIKDCAGCLLFTATFHGKSSHAGVSPEQGLSAITMACAAISGVRFGRIDDETTSNIGSITGGTATNVVADLVTVEGEIRSFTPERIEKELVKIRESFHAAAGAGGSVTIETKMDFYPYVLNAGSPVVTTVERAIRSAGLAPQGIRYTGGSDANSYNAKKIPAVNIGIGAQKPHSYDEFILIEDLITSTEIARAIILQ
jgi:tripeptide aminopeptidase